MRARRAIGMALLVGGCAPWVPAATVSGAGAHHSGACVVRQDAPCLPDELRLPAAEPAPLPVVGASGAVEVRWTAQEGFGLRGYRLTAWVEDGVLSGVAARWELAPGSGARERSGGTHEYRVRIDLPAFSAAHVRTVLEAVGRDGSPVLLAVRDVRTLPQPLADGVSGPRWRGGAPRLGQPGLPQRAWLALAAGASLETLPPAFQSHRPRTFPRRHGVTGVAWQRGPPPTLAG